MKYLDKYNFKNKKAFILGGSGTMGKEICKALLQHNAEVLNLDVRNDVSLKKLKVDFVKFDLKKIKFSQAKIMKLFKKYGAPEIFINCSYPRTKDWGKMHFKNLKLNAIQKNIDLQLSVSIWLNRLVAEEMRKKKIIGKILMIGSIYGVISQDESLYKNSNIELNAVYSSIKGGLINHAKQLAAYYGKYGIRANILSPGGIKGKIAGKKLLQTRSFIKNYVRKVPLNRMATAEDVASTSIFLVSDASDYLTGANIILDGGRTLV